MPTFDFTDPSGKGYSVDGPDGATPEQAFQILQHHLGATEAPKAPNVGTGEDLAKVATNAPGRLVAGIAGLPGDLLHLGMRALGDNLSPEPSYGSQAIRQSLGSDYEAKTGAGKLAQTAVDFAPAVIGGPETMGAKLLSRVAIPAAASEAAGALTGDNPYAKVAGALVGAGGATAAVRKFQEGAAARQAANALPSGEKLVETGSNQFNQARAMDVVVKPDFAQRTAADMRAALKDFDPEDAAVKDVFRKIDRLDNLASSSPGLPPVAIEMNDVENVRKQLSKLRLSPDASTREAAKKAQEVLTKNQMALTTADTLSGDAPLYSKTIQDAVGNYGAGKRSNIITGKQDLAELNAGTAGSGANGDNAMRQAMKQLARPINNMNVPVARKLGFNEAETAAITQGAMGTPVGNTARYLGKLAPTGSVSGVLGAGAGYGVGGPVGAIALPAAGYLAKKIGDLSTKRAVSAVDSLVRSRSPLAAQVASQLPPQIVQQLPAKTQRLLQALVLADPILSKQGSQPVGQPGT